VREISAFEISSRVTDLCVQACTILPPDLVNALKEAREREESPIGRDVLSQLLENAVLAARENMPACQDTGLAVVFVELGESVRVTGGNLLDAIEDGVRDGYKRGYLRKSVVSSPLNRRNTSDNAPPIIHLDLIPGDSLKISVLAKGAGADNMSRMRMMAPAEGIEAVKEFVVGAVEQAGASACPPLVVGVGLGGNFERCALLAKKALLRPVGQRHPGNREAELESELLELINATGIGPMGMGGRITALAVHVETHPCHIASLPVAVNLQCHAHRHASHQWE